MSTQHATTAIDRSDLRLSCESLRWSCPEAWLPFSSTAEVDPIVGIVGQDDALQALHFGLEMTGPGQNIFVRGLAGSGRLTLVRQLIELVRPTSKPAPDRCYVHNFAQPDRPRLISLPRGRGPALAAAVEDLVHFIREELGPYLASDAVRSLRTALDDRAQDRIRQIGKPFDEELQANGLALVPLEVGQTVQPIILPVLDGEAVTPDKFKELRKSGRVTDAEAEAIHVKVAAFARRFQEVSLRIDEAQNTHRGEVRKLYEDEARKALRREIRPIESAFPHEPVHRFLSDVVDDVVGRRIKSLAEGKDFTRSYRVNVLLTHESEDPCPVVIENSPTLQSLLGSVDREFHAGSTIRSDHLMIRAGNLLRADGGYLILEARDVILEPGAWKMLLRTLRTGKLEIVPPEFTGLWWGPVLKPEPIEIDVKVVLLGDPDLYYALDTFEPDFPQQFKVLADFESTIARNEQSARYYAGVLSHISHQEDLLPFSRSAVRALCEHGARVAARRDRLTIRFGRVLDIAREGAFLAKKRGSQEVGEPDIREAIRLSKHRADLPSRRFRRLVADGTLRIQIKDSAIGQVNGLAVIQAGPMIYGFPSRITATIGAGTAGTIDIEREAELSGAIHTKGFYILGGLLRTLLRTTHPLAFSASVAFEQSYGGIDGDSASGAEICCLLSALTGVPLRQDLAMTGAIDQLGHVQPVGAVTEKIEGFFDTCLDQGLTGTQGVIIPRGNAGDLMLREDVVSACREKKFHVYAVERVEEVLEILTGWAAGIRGEDGCYPPESLLGRAEMRALTYWNMVSGAAGEAVEGAGEEKPAEESADKD